MFLLEAFLFLKLSQELRKTISTAYKPLGSWTNNYLTKLNKCVCMPKKENETVSCLNGFAQQNISNITTRGKSICVE